MKKFKKRRLLIIAAFSAIFAYIFNKLVVKLAIKNNNLFSSNSNQYSWKHGNIFYSKYGSGSPILLIHDLDAISSEYEWNKIIGPLAMNHTVYTLDLIGCGRSDKPMITYTNYLYVQLISDFVKDIVGLHTDVVATGLSTTFVTMACYQNENLFNNILYINSPSILETMNLPKKSLKLEKKLLEMPLIGSFLFNLIVSKRNIKAIFEKKYFYDKNNISNKLVNIYHEAAHTNDTYSRFLYASIISSFTNVNTSKALGSLNNNIYLIFGDHVENLECRMDEYFEVNSNIETITIPNTKHLPQLENPNDMVTTIEEILTFER